MSGLCLNCCSNLFSLFYFDVLFFAFLLINVRMSAEMVSCIAVESLSILEKMHTKGYALG